jgi:hypothetical protein
VEYTDTISPVCLVPNCLNDDSGQAVIAMGWGDTTDGGSNSDYLRHAQLSTVPLSKCSRKWGGSIDSTQMLCAFKEGQDTCQVSDAILPEQASSCGSMNMEENSSLTVLFFYYHRMTVAAHWSLKTNPKMTSHAVLCKLVSSALEKVCCQLSLLFPFTFSQ